MSPCGQPPQAPIVATWKLFSKSNVYYLRDKSHYVNTLQFCYSIVHDPNFPSTATSTYRLLRTDPKVFRYDFPCLSIESRRWVSLNRILFRDSSSFNKDWKQIRWRDLHHKNLPWLLFTLCLLFLVPKKFWTALMGNWRQNSLGLMAKLLWISVVRRGSASCFRIPRNLRGCKSCRIYGTKNQTYLYRSSPLGGACRPLAVFYSLQSWAVSHWDELKI